MNTVLLLSNDSQVQRLFESAFDARFVLVPPPNEPSRAKYDALFATWLRLVDAVILDGIALGQTMRWAVESLATAQPVIARLTAGQRAQYSMPESWLLIGDTDSPQQLRQSLSTFLHLHETRTRLDRADVRRQAIPEPPRMTSFALDSHRYRDALKNLSRLLGQQHGQTELLAEFLQLVREMLGVGKLAIFSRRSTGGLFDGDKEVASDSLTVACSHGVSPSVVEHLRLTLDAGIGGCLSREARILRRRESMEDARAEREFDLLGMEVAVPMFEDDQLLGVLSFSGKVTGEPVTNEELELVYQLATQLSQAMRAVQLAERISAQQRLMSEVLAHVHSGVIVVDQDERILAINDQFRLLLELGSQPLVGQPLGEVPGRVSDVVFEVLGSSTANLDREVRLSRTNRPLRVRATRFEQTDTGKAVVVALVEDLTQQKREQAHQREMADKEFLMRLAFRLSHELKNSLVSIKIFAQLLPERYEEKDFREQFSVVVANEVNRVDVLVNNLTFFSHPLVLVHDDVVLTDLLESCIKNVAGEFSRKQLAQVVGTGEKPPEGMPIVTLKKNLAHKLARLEGDKLRLMQAFEHVLRNSLQAMPAGGRMNISTSDAQPADWPGGQLPVGGAVKIEFQDTGEGIALESLARVTEPFVTTRNVGVGLGLTIVKKIVERHCGRVEIDSMLGRSTTVAIVLPVKAQPHPEDTLLQDMAKNARPDDVGESGAATRLPLGREHGERS